MRADRQRRRRRRAGTLKLAYKIAVIILLALCLIKLDNLSVMAVDGLDQAMEIRREMAEPAMEPVTAECAAMEFEITAYCACKKCCGKSDGITATGTIATEGRTAGSDWSVLPAGTAIDIEGIGRRTVEDNGNFTGNKIDIFMESHRAALEFGRQTRSVTVVDGGIFK